jgi:hypothetical protein
MENQKNINKIQNVSIPCNTEWNKSLPREVGTHAIKKPYHE